MTDPVIPGAFAALACEPVTPATAMALTSWPAPSSVGAFAVALTVEGPAGASPVQVSLHVSSEDLHLVLRALVASGVDAPIVDRQLGRRPGETLSLRVDLGNVRPMAVDGMPDGVVETLQAGKTLATVADSLLTGAVRDLGNTSLTLAGAARTFRLALAALEGGGP